MLAEDAGVPGMARIGEVDPSRKKKYLPCKFDLSLAGTLHAVMTIAQRLDSESF
jgi:hypothetical protein